MVMPKVSVIIPTYNRPEFLKEAVQSVLAQICHDYEIILISDASDGNLKKEHRAIANLSSSIFLYHLPTHQGVSQARNLGLNQAKGDYILFLDDDDLIDPKLLESSLTYFGNDKEIDVVTCWNKFFLTPASLNPVDPNFLLFGCRRERVRSIKRWLDRLRTKQIEELEKTPFSTLLKTCPPINSSLIKKSSIGDINFDKDLTYGEDWYFWLLLAYKGCRFKCNPNVYTFVRKHADNAVTYRTLQSKKIINFLEKLKTSEITFNRHDLFILQAHFLLNLMKQRRLKCLKHLFSMLKSPDLLIKYFYAFLMREISAK